MWLKITQNYSPNFNTPKRQKKNIKYIIIHYTGMKNELSALNRLTDYKSKVSAHYFIKKNGKIINLVPDLYEAWHAGKSNWKNIKRKELAVYGIYNLIRVDRVEIKKYSSNFQKKGLKSDWKKEKPEKF